MADGYRGVLGAFTYAFRASDSWLLRSYVAVSAVLAAAVALLFGLGLVVLIARTAGLRGGTLTLSRAFFVLVGLFVVVPLVAPTLLVARRHRRGEAREDRYDAALALVGYLFVLSLYAGLLVTTPAASEPVPRGPLAPVVSVLYSLPRAAGLVFPLVGAALIWLVHRLTR